MSDQNPTQVVTVFLENSGKIALLRRSARVGTYRGYWAGVSGHVERLPLEQAYMELKEEVGLERSEVKLRGMGIPFTVDDTDIGREWLVFPFLFNVPYANDIALDWESDELRWIDPAEIGDYRSVPGLMEALDSVWPEFGDDKFWKAMESVATDTVHGATTLSHNALQAVSELCDRDRSISRSRAARAVAAVRPSMGLFAHLASRMIKEDSIPKRIADEVWSAAHKSALNAAEAISDCITVLTLSYSSAVRDALLIRAGTHKPLKVITAESRPGMEGVTLASDLAKEHIEVTVITDAQLTDALRSCDAALVGCDAINGSNNIINKVGTLSAALAAREFGVRCCCVTQTLKITPPGYPEVREEQNPDAVGTGEGLRFRNVVFDEIPFDLFTRVICENGDLTVERIDRIRSTLSAV